MISITEIQEHRGVTVLESEPGEFHFSVQAHGISGGLATTIPLDVVCPVVGQNLLLLRATITPPDGVACPDSWTTNSIESTIQSAINTFRRIQKCKDDEEAKRTKKASKIDREVRFRMALSQAVSEWMSASEYFTLSEYLAICGEVFSSATQNVNNHRTNESSDPSS